jgi:uncharacterized membrane protein
MYAKLVIAALIVAGLAASHWKVYIAGQAKTQAKWDELTAVANENARELERMNFKSKENALENQKRGLVANATAARRAADTAIGLLDASDRSLQASRENHAACIVSAATHAELLGRCESRYRGLAEKAQGHATDVKALIESWPK